MKSKLEVLDRQDKKKKEKQAAQQAKTDKATLKEQYKESKKQQRLQVRPSLGKKVFPVRRVAQKTASREVGKSFSFSFY